MAVDLHIKKSDGKLSKKSIAMIVEQTREVEQKRLNRVKAKAKAVENILLPLDESDSEDDGIEEPQFKRSF